MFSYINCECLCYSKLCSGKHNDGGTCESVFGAIVSKPSRRHRVLRPLPSGHGDSSLCAMGLRYSRFPRCLCYLFLALCGALHPQPLVASSRQVQNIQQPSGSSQNKSNSFNKVGDTLEELTLCMSTSDSNWVLWGWGTDAPGLNQARQ